MPKQNIKELIRECIQEILDEELDIPTQDGTSKTASAEDQQKAKDATKSGHDVKFVKPGEMEEGAVEGDEAAQKIVEAYEKLQEALDDAADIEDFADKNGNAKMKKLAGVLVKQLQEVVNTMAELKKIKAEIMEEETEKASEHGDKVIKALGKYLKTDDQGKSLKEKYMPYIQAAYRKGKSPKEIAERIKDHRFEL